MEKSCSVLEIFTVIISNYPVNPVNFEDFFLEESLLGKGGQFLDGVWGY